MDVRAFVTARIDELEEQSVEDRAYTGVGDWAIARCAAMRQIVQVGSEREVRALASTWADHPDYPRPRMRWFRL